MSEFVILDKATGNIIPTNISKSEVRKYVSNLTDMSKSEILTQVNYIKRITTSIEDEIKSFIKSNVELDPNTLDASWLGHRVSQAIRYTFSKELFEKEGTEKEKKIIAEAEKIQEKYKKPNPYILIK